MCKWGLMIFLLKFCLKNAKNKPKLMCQLLIFDDELI